MNDNLSLASAITALTAAKRAVGYKYDAEGRILARFEAFCREEFPGLDTVTKDSAEAWIAAGRERGVRLATLQGLAAPVRELARWLGRRGIAAYVLPARTLPGRPATSRTSTPTGNSRTCSPRRTDAITVPRSRSGTWSCRCCSGRSTPAACASPKPGCSAPATSTSAPGSCRSATPRAVRTGRSPFPSRCGTGWPATGRRAFRSCGDCALSYWPRMRILYSRVNVRRFGRDARGPSGLATVPSCLSRAAFTSAIDIVTSSRSNSRPA